MKIKCDTVQKAEEPWDYFSLDTTFDEIVVNEAWERRYFSPLNQHRVKQKSQFYRWKIMWLVLQSLRSSCLLSGISGRTVDMRKNIGGGFWKPWAENDLQSPGGPVGLLWEVMWVRTEWGVSEGRCGVRTGNRDVWKPQVKMSMSQWGT